MEIQIQDLITSIKNDGIDKAKKEAEEIINKADAEAQAIIKGAFDAFGELIGFGIHAVEGFR